VNKDTTSTRLNEIEKRLEKLEHTLAGRTPVEVRAAKPKKMSAKEFLLAKKVGSEVQKVLALAYFLEQMEGLASINVADLETVFRLAREKLPKNMNDVVNKNVARGFMMEAKEKKDSKKAWHLTSSGERHVANEMNQ